MTTQSISQVSQSGGGINTQSATSATSPTSPSSINEFKEMLQMMIPLMAMQSMSSLTSSTSSEGNSFGFNFNSFMMPTMFSLMEQMMSMELSGQEEEETSLEISGNSAVSITTLSAASSIHINQFDAEISVGGDGINSNCGPTSLSIALHALGLKVKGETANSSDGQIVDLARLSMVKDSNRDGVDFNGRRAESEHNSYTNFSDLMTGAQAAGATVKTIGNNAQSIQNAINEGGVVIVSGTFSGKYPAPWTGDRGIDNYGAPGNATAHIIAVTGYDEQENRFIVNDPARNSPLFVDAESLEYFMQGNAGAIALYN